MIIHEGTKYWYQNDKLHRTDGPAVIHPDCIKQWYQNGIRHRSDGPAIECPDGNTCWYFHGKGELYLMAKSLSIGQVIEVQVGGQALHTHNKAAIVLKYMEDNIYMILLGDEKLFVYMVNI